MENIKVTSIDQLKLMSGGEIVKLPPFIQGQDFYAKLRRPSMLKLVQSGQIPNSLLRRLVQRLTSQGQRLMLSLLFHAALPM